MLVLPSMSDTSETQPPSYALSMTTAQASPGLVWIPIAPARAKRACDRSCSVTMTESESSEGISRLLSAATTAAAAMAAKTIGIQTIVCTSLLVQQRACPSAAIRFAHHSPSPLFFRGASCPWLHDGGSLAGKD